MRANLSWREVYAARPSCALGAVLMLLTFQVDATEINTVFNPENLAETLKPLSQSAAPTGIIAPAGQIERLLKPSLIKEILDKLPPEQQEALEEDNYTYAELQHNASPAPASKEESSITKGKAMPDIDDVRAHLLARPLMLSKEQEKLLQSSLLPQFLYREGDTFGGGAAFMEALGAALPASKAPPKFFVSSIIWVNGNTWSLWLNGQKLSANNQVVNNESGEVRVASVSHNSVTFEWHPDSVMRLSPNWRSLLRPKADDVSAFISNDGLLIYNRGTNVLEFTLKPNQTLDVASMRVVEGQGSQLLGPRGG